MWRHVLKTHPFFNPLWLRRIVHMLPSYVKAWNVDKKMHLAYYGLGWIVLPLLVLMTKPIYVIVPITLFEQVFKKQLSAFTIEVHNIIIWF
jgi:fucose 4-O-acetylase-like acetyltransferase